MTAEQKEIIKTMRIKGNSYAQISNKVHLREGTIKAFCSRNKIYMPKVNSNQPQFKKGEFCRSCGKAIMQNKIAKQRLFCDDKCRVNWWNENQDKVNKKAIYKIKCAYCGVGFESYGNKSRKYCSHSCYINFKKAGVANDQRTI